jgi:hypothetical protein
VAGIAIVTHLGQTDGQHTADTGPRVTGEWLRWLLGVVMAGSAFWYGFGERVSVLETRQESLQSQIQQYQQQYQQDRQELRQDIRELQYKIDRLLEIQQRQRR